ncbi:MAG: DUF6580 family putative transport protein [bacterium]
MEISKKGKNIEFLIALLFILTAVVLRVLPHPPNFSPVAAIALFGAVYFSKKIALVLPIAAMAISDAFIGFYDVKLMTVVYGSFLLCVVVGFWLKKNKKWYTILGSSCLVALVFFLLTNFAVWAFAPWYAKTFSGLIQCYFMALPFFRNTLLGNLFYVAVSFGAFELTRVLIAKKFKLQNKKTYGLQPKHN